MKHKINRLLIHILVLNMVFTMVVMPTVIASDGTPKHPVDTNDISVDLGDDIDSISDDIEQLPEEVPDPADSIQAAGVNVSPTELKLQFRILEVKAEDMTNPECATYPIIGRVNEDEISLGGTSALRYGLGPIQYRDLGEFCDGDRRDYSQDPWVFHTFELQDFPHTVSITLLMAERDVNGGKEKFRDEMVVKQEDKVEEQFFDSLDPTVVTAAVSENNPEEFEEILKDNLREEFRKNSKNIFEAIWEWLKNLFGTPDDMFTGDTISLTVNSPGLSWGGKTTSPRAAIKLYEGTGTYRVVFDWHIVRGPTVSSSTVNAASETDIDANWGTPPWNQASMKLPPLLWTKPGAASYAKNVNLVSAHSGKCVEVRKHSNGDLAIVQQNTCKDSNAKHQIFTLSPNGYYYQIVAAHSGKCLSLVPGLVTYTNGAEIKQVPCANSNNKQQLWIARPIPGSQKFALVSALTGKCFDVSAASTANRARIHQWDCVIKNQNNQIWSFEQPKLPPAPKSSKLYLPIVAREGGL